MIAYLILVHRYPDQFKRLFKAIYHSCKMLLEILILIASFPIGYLLAYTTKEELFSGRKWFKIIILLLIILSIIFLIINKIAVFYTLLFILIVVLISFIKSFDKKWTRKR